MDDFDESLSEELEEDIRIQCTVPFSIGKTRLDAFLSSSIERSRVKLKQYVLDGHCTVNGEVCRIPDMRMQGGEQVEISLPCEETPLFPEPGELEILYRDEDIAVINKPAGLTVHPCPNCPSGTLVNRLLFLFPSLREQPGVRPGIVHRLDKDTSGLLIAALSERARLELAKAFASRTIHKTYLAMTYGIPALQGICKDPIGRHRTIKSRMDVIPENHGGKPAHTEWEVLHSWKENGTALSAVRLFTGRTHQIRVHFAHLGFPLIGDSVYGNTLSAAKAPRQMLHAWKLEFIHPMTAQPLSFICPPPEDFLNVVSKSFHRGTKIILTGMPGCGKSSVLQSMKKRGAKIWSADEEVLAQYQPGSDGVYLIRQRFGDSFLTEKGAVDKSKLTMFLMEKPEKRRELEALIHPLVFQSLEAFFSDCNEELLVAEIPLWFETGWKKPEDSFVAVITCPNEMRYCRLRETRNWTEEKIQSMEHWQWKQEKKIASADLCLHNDGSREDLDREINVFFDFLERQKQRQEEVKKKALMQILNTSAF